MADITTPEQARAYVASWTGQPGEASYLKLALEGVNLAAAISARQQQGTQQLAGYQAAARVLAAGLQLAEAQATYDRLRAYQGRLLRYHDEAPDGDPRKHIVEGQLDELRPRVAEAERLLGLAADAAIEEGL